ncbi:hypothetical protein ABTK76_19410, partial [Acinetobacter baumannii]
QPADTTLPAFTCDLGVTPAEAVAHHRGMFTPARLRITAALLATVLGLVVALGMPERAWLDGPPAVQAPQR